MNAIKATKCGTDRDREKPSAYFASLPILFLKFSNSEMPSKRGTDNSLRRIACHFTFSWLCDCACEGTLVVAMPPCVSSSLLFFCLLFKILCRRRWCHSHINYCRLSYVCVFLSIQATEMFVYRIRFNKFQFIIHTTKPFEQFNVYSLCDFAFSNFRSTLIIPRM